MEERIGWVRADDHHLNGCGKVKENGNFAPFQHRCSRFQLFRVIFFPVAADQHRPQWLGKVKGNGNLGGYLLKTGAHHSSWHPEVAQVNISTKAFSLFATLCTFLTFYQADIENFKLISKYSKTKELRKKISD